MYPWSPPRACETRASHGRILVVDSNAVSCDDVGDTLERAGFDVSFARSAGAALALTAVDAPDLVLLDGAMLDQGGADLLTRLRAPARMRGVLIFVLAPPHLEGAAPALGVDVCLPRRVDPRVLKARITLSLRIRSRAPRRPRPRSTAPRPRLMPPRGAGSVPPAPPC